MSEKNDSALVVLEEVLLAARRAAEQAQSDEPSQFNSGLKTAYYDVLTVALEQAEMMGLDPRDFGMEGYDPDVLLRKDRAA